MGNNREIKADVIKSNTTSDIDLAPSGVVKLSNYNPNAELQLNSNSEIEGRVSSYNKTTDPTISDNNSLGYNTGSHWLNTDYRKLYILSELNVVDAIAASFTGQVTGMTTDVTITADNAGTTGNSISLAFDGIDDIDTVIAAWNLANASNTASIISGDGSQVPDNLETIDLAGGAEAIDDATWTRVKEVIIDTAANIAALTREAGNLYYATDTKEYSGDDGTSLISLGGGGVTSDTLANIQALPRQAGSLYWSTDTDEYLGDDGTNLIPIDITIGTRANLDSRTKFTGRIYYSDDEQKWLGYDGSTLKNIGGSGGLFNLYENGDTENVTDTSNETTGNGSFDGGGSANGAYSISTTAADIISGTRVRKYVLNATPGNSDDDYIASEVIPVPQGYRGGEFEYLLWYKYDGADGDINAIVWDDTNSKVLLTYPLTAANRSNDVADLEILAPYIPSDCENIKIGFQVVTHATGSEVLLWDDQTVSPYANNKRNLIDRQNIRYDGIAGLSATNTRIPYCTSESYNDGPSIVSVSNSSTTGFEVTATKKCVVNIVWTYPASPSVYMGFSLNSTQLTTGITSITQADQRNHTYNGPGNDGYRFVSDSVEMEADDVLRLHTSGTVSSSLSFVTLTVESDSEYFVNSETGTENTFTARFDSAGVLISEGAPFVSGNASKGGTGLYNISFNTDHFGEIPAGEATTSNGTNTSANVNNEATTGITVDIKNVSGTAQDAPFTLTVTRQGTDYKLPSATAAVPSQRIAVIKDVKSSGVNGGSSSTSSWLTRDLNTLSGDISFLEVDTNQLIIQPGRYYYEFSLPFVVGGAQGRFRDVDNNLTIDNPGDSSTSGTGSSGNGTNIIKGYFEITEVTTFEVQQQLSVATGSVGLGQARSFGDGEVYTQGFVTKLR